MPKRTNWFQQTIARVVSILEDGHAVTESVLFDDPITGKPREVDIVVVRGKLIGQQVQIGIECVDHSASKKKKKADVQWVEMQYGKHSRLKATDFVILVSNTGFTATALIVAESLGYQAVTPNIATSDLANLIAEELGLTIGAFQLQVLTASYTTAEPPSTRAIQATDVFVNPVGSTLVSSIDLLNDVAWQKIGNDGLLGASEDPHYRVIPVSIDHPHHEGVSVAAMVFDGHAERPAVVAKLELSILLMATGTAQVHLTEMGNFNGHQFATGVSPTGATGARSVAMPSGGGMRIDTAFSFPGPDKNRQSLCSTVKLQFGRRPQRSP